jgi:predicted RNA-binding protein with PIN domain
VSEKAAEQETALLVDGNNVMGTTPDGWWRDRPAAVRRLFDRLQRYVVASGQPLELVLDVPQPDLAEGDHDGVIVRYATRKGRDAGDDRIRQLLDTRDTTGVQVVTSDRALAESARQKGATVTGAGAFLRRLEEAGC